MHGQGSGNLSAPQEARRLRLDWEAREKRLQSLRVRAMVRSLREKAPVTDVDFDRVFPKPLRQLSEVHWTPVSVARRAAELLAKDERSRILDVGAGAGKFSLIGALTTASQFIGIEQRDYLANAGRTIAETLAIPRVTFIHGDLADLDWSFFDGFYLFNPFYENLVDSIRMDRLVELSEDRFARHVRLTQAKLRPLRIGTRVVTYHGFGGTMPLGYHRVLEEPAGSGRLQLWIKETADVQEA